MKNKEELFIRYVDNQLSEVESELFRKELLNDPNLKEEYEKFLLNFNQLNYDIELDERYFNTLIPKALSRLENSKSILRIRMAFALSILIILMYFLFFTNNSNKVGAKFTFNELYEINSGDIEINENLISDVLKYNNSYVFDDLIISDILVEGTEIDESLFDYLESNIREDDIDESLLNQFSGTEFNLVYNELLGKKIMGGK